MVSNKACVVDSTLDLPRILCLHGGGTNSRIFRMQCRVLERHLESSFRLVYAEGPFHCTRPGPDVTSVYANYGPFKSWLPMFDDDVKRSSDSVVENLNYALKTAIDADDCSGATGEWVAVLGFSQGAKVAASLLFLQQTRRTRSISSAVQIPEFKFGVIMAGRGPLTWFGTEDTKPQGLGDPTTPSTITSMPPVPLGSREHILEVPTIHVHGLEDPGIELHRALLRQYCDANTTTLIEWDGDHRLPIKTKDVSPVVEEILRHAR